MTSRCMAEWKRRRLWCAAILTASCLAHLLFIFTFSTSNQQLVFSAPANYSVPLASLTTTSEPALDQSPPHLIIIVSSCPRSGSSLLGEMMSVAAQAVYFFEPFYYHLKKHVTNVTDSEVTTVLTDLLTCRLTHSSVMREATFRKFIWKSRVGQMPSRLTLSAASMAKECNQSSARVVKVIRVRLAPVLRLLQHPKIGRHVRIIHLVRDPRGIVNSLLERADIWGNVTDSLTTRSCQPLRQDLAVAAGVTEARYTRVHYEQLAMRPRQTAARLLRAVGLADTPELQLYLQRHWNQSTSAARRSTILRRGPMLNRSMNISQMLKRRQQSLVRSRYSASNTLTYFGTARDTKFDPFHWQRELNPKIKRVIETNCSDVLQRLAEDGNAYYNVTPS